MSRTGWPFAEIPAGEPEERDKVMGAPVRDDMRCDWPPTTSSVETW